MRKPKNMEGYTSRDDAARFLIALAHQMLSQPASDQIKVRVQFSRWNDEWLNDPKPAVVVKSISHGTKAKATGETK